MNESQDVCGTLAAAVPSKTALGILLIENTKPAQLLAANTIFQHHSGKSAKSDRLFPEAEHNSLHDETDYVVYLLPGTYHLPVWVCIAQK